MKVGDSVIELVLGDITEQDTDAIVNAANSTMMGGSGVDGAIHKAAGLRLTGECMRIGGCKAGDAKITTGGNLKAKNVIHAVGPVYIGGYAGEKDVLASAYRRSLEVAVENGIETIAFPSISTGAYRYPVDDAAKIAIKTVKTFLKDHPQIKLVRFVLFDENTFKAYQAKLK